MINVIYRPSRADLSVKFHETIDGEKTFVYCNHVGAENREIEIPAYTYDEGIATPDDTETIEALHCKACNTWLNDDGTEA